MSTPKMNVVEEKVDDGSAVIIGEEPSTEGEEVVEKAPLLELATTACCGAYTQTSVQAAIKQMHDHMMKTINMLRGQLADTEQELIKATTADHRTLLAESERKINKQSEKAAHQIRTIDILSRRVSFLEKNLPHLPTPSFMFVRKVERKSDGATAAVGNPTSFTLPVEPKAVSPIPNPPMVTTSAKPPTVVLRRLQFTTLVEKNVDDDDQGWTPSGKGACYSCNVCPYTSSSERMMKQHASTMHGKFVCDFDTMCTYRSATKQGLITHSRAHTHNPKRVYRRIAPKSGIPPMTIPLTTRIIYPTGDPAHAIDSTPQSPPLPTKRPPMTVRQTLDSQRRNTVRPKFLRPPQPGVPGLLRHLRLSKARVLTPHPLPHPHAPPPSLAADMFDNDLVEDYEPENRHPRSSPPDLTPPPVKPKQRVDSVEDTFVVVAD